jgi:hydroxyethylthiazole kinase-like uncharacterized protein yjeF
MGDGVGVDIASVERLKKAAEDPAFVARVYTDREKADCERVPDRWASRWAAKEAVRKLAGGFGWEALPGYKEIEVAIEESGAPKVLVNGEPVPVSLSLSHDGDSAVAVAIAQASWFGPLSTAVPGDLRLPERPQDASKWAFGTVVVIGGSMGMQGGCFLSAMGAARAGAGLVQLCTAASAWPAIAAKAVEVMAYALPEQDGSLSALSTNDLLTNHLSHADAAVIGPGLGRTAGVEAMLASLLPNLPCPAVIDADALNFAAEVNFDWQTIKRPLVLTPHVRELARLVDATVEEVERDRESVTKDLAKKSGAVVLCKGSHTFIAGPDGRTVADQHSTSALATGGSGDVLAGVIAAFVAGGLDPFAAAQAGVFIHGESGVQLEQTRGRAGVIASDLLDKLPVVQERVRRVLESRR